MKIDASLMLDNLKDVPHAARAAEEIGFDAVWCAETKHEVFLPLPLIAEHTKRMHFGTGIAIAFARSPMVLANAAWDLAAQSGGRFMLGLGTQVKAHVERRFGMSWEQPVPKLRETVLAIRAIWDCWQNGTPLDFRGEYYKLTLMTPFFSPGPIDTPHVPIYLAGVNTALCRLGGEVGDGFHVHAFHTAKYLREVIVPAIEAGAAKSGRSRANVQMSGIGFVITNDEEREAVRSQISFYASTPSYRSVLDCHGWGETGEKLSRMAARGRWEAMPPEISDEMLGEFAVQGIPSEVPGKLMAKYDGLLDRLWLYQPFLPGQREDFWHTVVEGIHSLGRA